MRRLNSENVQPPGGFRYFVGETATWVPTQRDPFTNIIDLMEAVRAHHKANRLPLPPNLRELIEDQICTRLNDPAWCNSGTILTEAQVHAARAGKTGFGIKDVIAFSATMADWAIAGGRRVTDDQLTARIKTCLRCPMHSDPIGCGPCNSGPLKTIALRLLAGSPHPLDRDLKSCAVCGCYLPVKTRIPTDILHKRLKPEVLERFPDYCWMKTEVIPAPEPVLEEAAT
jgi:hypothetical protein